jgi:hypothetical protein
LIGIFLYARIGNKGYGIVLLDHECFFFPWNRKLQLKALYLTRGMTVPRPGHNSEQIVSILLSNFLGGCRLLAYVHHHFSAVVLANEEINLAGVFSFQVAEGAGMVRRK